MNDINMFYAVFEEYGLPPKVIFPTYGLAEHTLLVCSNGSQVLHVDRFNLEKCGKAVLVMNNNNNNSNGGAGTSPSAAQGDSSRVVTIVGCGYPREYEDRGVSVRIVKHDSVATDTTTTTTGSGRVPPVTNGADGRGIKLKDLEVLCLRLFVFVHSACTYMYFPTRICVFRTFSFFFF
jgi:hypothetical protein